MASVTVKNIAKIAGVSATTVSRCVHSPELVRPATLQRVQEMMREHRYVYNAAAASLSRRRSSAVAVTIPTPEVFVFAQTLVGIQEVAFKRNSPLFVGNTHYNPALERGILRQCLEHRIGGIIMAGYDPSNEGQVLELAPNGIPCVIIWEKPDNEQFDYVGIDNYQGTRSALDYLLALGHRRIGAVLGPTATNSRSRHRLQAYQDALAVWGIPYDPGLVLIREPMLLPGKEAAVYFLSLPTTPTAIFVGSDHLAIALMAALREQGVRVPEDVSICGFDGNDVAAYLVPALTTVRVPSTEMGRLAMTFLLEMQAEEMRVRPRRCLLDTELLIRQSCAPKQQ